MRSRKNIPDAIKSGRPLPGRVLRVLSRPTPPGWMRRLRLEPEDLVAIPLCLVWCLGFVLISSYVGNGLERSMGAPAVVSASDPGSLWKALVIVASVTMTAVRQLFGK
ncbi:MAG: hypothetical protein HYX26_10765 [Acidobacteriales bacterium]|nr:hypothetical protein [Terriglobales bacterium]